MWYGTWKLPSRDGYISNNSGNFSFVQNEGFNKGKNALDPNIAVAICQICFKLKQTLAEFRSKYNKEYVPYYSPLSYIPY